MNVGNRIARLRKSKKMTQQDLAQKLFVTDKTISSWEANRTEPSLDLLMKLSEFFDCSVGYLIYGKIQRNDIEVEIKIKLTENEYRDIELFLKDKAKFINESKQIDTYYQPLSRRFINENFKNGGEVREWLRIGERGEKNILNYKNWYDSKYCDEYEVEIDDTKN